MGCEVWEVSVVGIGKNAILLDNHFMISADFSNPKYLDR